MTNTIGKGVISFVASEVLLKVAVTEAAIDAMKEAEGAKTGLKGNTAQLGK